jgi:hypothetical protein
VFIPIVRRTITVRARDVVHLPFNCESCRLSVWAHAWADGVGTATMAYLAPDENAARFRAYENARARAYASLSQVPCPRCGAHSQAQRALLYAWEQRVVSRKKLRLVTALVVLGLAFLIASAFAIGGLSEGGPGSGGAAVILFAFFMAGGAGMAGLLYAVLGPGPRPALANYIPHNVSFDPPDPSTVQGSYRGY